MGGGGKRDQIFQIFYFKCYNFASQPDWHDWQDWMTHFIEQLWLKKYQAIICQSLGTFVEAYWMGHIRFLTSFYWSVPCTA